uniref:Uncharacterized protein n=1 Tax=Glossina palpalis gambiensis TaxID=67801 RepID=A0A1B0B8Y9_9MUSC
MNSKKLFVFIVIQLFFNHHVILSNILPSNDRKYVVRQQRRKAGYGFRVSNDLDMHQNAQGVTTDYCGVILRKVVVLTEKTFFRKLKGNYIVYGTITNFTQPSRKFKQIVTWKCNQNEKDDEPQLMLIQLKENMNLDSMRAKIIKLPSEDYKSKMKCDLIDRDEDLCLQIAKEFIMFRDDCIQIHTQLE